MTDTTTTYGHMGHNPTPGSIQTPRDLAELNTDLTWPHGLRVYSEMYRSDPAVRAVIRAVVLPVMRAPTDINHGNAEEIVCRDVANMTRLPLEGDPTVHRRGRQRNRFVWRHFVRQALTAGLRDGHSVHEMIWEDGTNGRYLKRLSERPALTIAGFDVDPDGELLGVAQYPQGHGREHWMRGRQGLIEIPANKLVVYSNEREGAAWQGNSILRPAYKHWRAKDMLMRTDLIRHERNGVGIPWITLPDNASEATVEEHAAIAAEMRGGSSAGGAGAGAVLELHGVKGQTTDVLASLRWQDEQIVRTTLGMFMNLGQTETGSRALGQSFIDVFIAGVEAIAADFVDYVNDWLIENYVDQRYGPDTEIPQVTVSGIGEDTRSIALMLGEFVVNGAITVDDELESWIREQLGAPAADPSTRRERSAPTVPVAAGAHPKVSARQVRAAADDTAEDTIKGRRLARIATLFAPLVQDALTGLLDIGAAVRSFYDWIADRTWRDDDELRNLVAAWQSTWAVNNPVDTADLAGIYDEMMQAAYAAGLDGDVETGVDWDTWQPGDPIAADLLDGPGLQELLDDADIQIQSVADTSLERLGTQLGDAVREGKSVDQAAADIRDTLLVQYEYRAEQIASTEMNRAMTTATMDSYVESPDVEQYGIVLSDRPCDLCIENAENGPYPLGVEPPNGLPPTHPNCLCAVVPVVTPVEDAA